MSRALEIEMELDLKSNVKTEFPKKCEWLLFIFLGKFSFYNSSFFHVRHCLRGSVRPPKTTVPWNPLNSFFGILSQWYLELKQSGKNKQNFTNNSGFFSKMGEMGPKLANMVFFVYFERFCHYFFCLISFKMKNYFILSQLKILVLKLWTEMHSVNQMCDLSVISQERSEGSSWFFACT